jgi:hypothetical protein
MTTENTGDSSYDQLLNELYWSSTQTIDEIVDELGVGRGTLYASIRPLDAGGTCAACQGTLVFLNRTGRAAGTGSCEECGMEATIQVQGASADELGRGPTRSRASRGDPRVIHGYDDRGRWDRWRQDLGAVAPERAALIGGAAAIGVVVGAAAIRALRH